MAFIAFEGIDGSGKTTLIAGFQKFLQNDKGSATTCIVTREPGGTRLGDAIRNLLLNPDLEPPVPRAELLLYEAGRAQHVENVIRPALAQNQWVLCDRFIASSVAFQVFGRGLAREMVDQLNQYAIQDVEPHLTVLLDLDPQQAELRQQKREGKLGQKADRFEQEARAFHERVREGYRKLAEESKYSERPWLVLDASQSSEKMMAGLCAHLRRLKWLA